MKLILQAIILTTAFLAFAQKAPGPASAPGPSEAGAYSPHPNPAGMDAPPPAERSPQDVFMQHPKLAVKLQKLLPEGITTPRRSASGYLDVEKVQLPFSFLEMNRLRWDRDRSTLTKVLSWESKSQVKRN